MNIVMVAGEFPPVCAGPGYYVYGLAKALTEIGFNITVLTRSTILGSRSSEREGVLVKELPFVPIYPLHIAYHRYALANWFRKTATKYDLIHYHSPLVPFVKMNAPCVATEHGTTYGDLANRPATTLDSVVAKALGGYLARLDAAVVRSVDGIAAVSEDTKTELRRVYGITKPITVVGNAVDTDFFHPIEGGCRGDYVLYVGRIDPRKGILDLLEASKLISARRPSTRFVFVGSGPASHMLESGLRKLGIEHRATLLGYVTRDALAKLYREAYLFVSPSYYEGLPTTVIEAMSSGLPVVATNAPGTRNLVNDGYNGSLVPVRDPKSLAEAILNLYEDKRMADSIGVNARTIVEDKYSWGVVAEKYAGFYRSIVN